jgi:hypothetical protein
MRVQVGRDKRIVQGRRQDDVLGLAHEFGQKLPPGRLRFKVVAPAAAVLDQNDFAGFGAYLGGEPVDAVHDGAQGLASEEPDLHVHDKQGVHHRS